MKGRQFMWPWAEGRADGGGHILKTLLLKKDLLVINLPPPVFYGFPEVHKLGILV